MSTLEQVVDAHLGRNESVHPEEIAALTKADRCDNGRCSAAAVVATLIPIKSGTGLLMWCDHHYRQNQEHLLEIACAVRDERAQLGER